MAGFFKGFGEYPPEYNREIHGPYNPSVYYGKRDTPFFDVKLKDFGSWLARRNKSPRAISQAISRAWFKYQINWVQTKKPTATYIFQMYFAYGLFMFLLDYNRFKQRRHFRYH